MLAKLALGNVRKSLRDYAVYFVTLVLGVAVFYAFNTISDQADFLENQQVGSLLGTLGDVMMGLTVFLACVLGFLMVYANNYLVRRRKRELGLYQVLGMRRAQVSAVLAIETLVASVASFVVGIVLGVLLSQLLVFVTAALFQDRVTYFTFRFSPYAFLLTLACFGIMFALMLLLNLRSIGRVRLADLMVSERTNESIKVRSLPVAVALFVAGLALIVVAYVRLLRDGLPITNDNDEQFLITTIMVVVGTILFFYALSGFLLSFIRRFDGVYWRGLNMFTLRQLNAKINTASISMAVISLILFLAITSVTGGMSICGTLNSNLEAHTPYDASVNVVYFGEGAGRTVPADAEGEPDPGCVVAHDEQDAAALLAAAGYDIASLGDYVQVQIKDGASLAGVDDGLSIRVMAQACGLALPSGMENSLSDTAGLDMISESDYNRLRAFLNLEPIDLAADEYLITTDMGTDMTKFYDAVMDAGYTMGLAGRTLHPASADVPQDASSALMNSPMGSNPGTVVVDDEIAAAASPYSAYINIRYTVPVERADAFVEDLSHIDTSQILVEGDARFGFIGTCVSRTENYLVSAGMTGVISYMAIYIGFVLVIACAAILAIQQLSAVSDSQQRYRLLGELGAPSGMVYRSLMVQTLIYFLFPLAVGLAHSFVALQVVVDLVGLFGNLDITSASMLTSTLFVVVYGGYLLVTYRVARSVVRQAMTGSRRIRQ